MYTGLYKSWCCVNNSSVCISNFVSEEFLVCLLLSTVISRIVCTLPGFFPLTSRETNETLGWYIFKAHFYLVLRVWETNCICLCFRCKLRGDNIYYNGQIICKKWWKMYFEISIWNNVVLTVMKYFFTVLIKSYLIHV